MLLLNGTDGGGGEDDQHTSRRRRSPSTSSLPVPANWGSTGIGRQGVVANESAASLIGSDSALLVRDKPPLPRGRGGSFGRKMKSRSLQKQPAGMDTDDTQQELSGRKRSVFKGALNFFKTR